MYTNKIKVKQKLDWLNVICRDDRSDKQGQEFLPLCMPVNLSFNTVSSYICPYSSKIGRRSLSSKFRGICPTNSLIASWSFIGIVVGAWETGPLGMCVSGIWGTPLVSVDILGLIWRPSTCLPVIQSLSRPNRSTFPRNTFKKLWSSITPRKI